MEWVTSDLYQAAFTIASGHPLTKMSGAYKKAFHFEMPPTEIERLKNAWYFEGQIDAQRYSECIRKLKSMVNTTT